MTNTEFAAGLRELADIYEAHPELSAPERLEIFMPAAIKAQFEDWVRAFSPVVQSPQRATDYFLAVQRILASGLTVEFTIYRDTVCKKVKRLQEVEAWDCPDSILADLQGVPAK